MKLRLLLLCVVLLAILLLACGIARLVRGEVINKHERILTIRLEDGESLRIGVTQEVFNSVSIGQSCTFYSDSEYTIYHKALECN